LSLLIFFLDLYLRRFKKEKRLRKRLQDQLEVETRRIQRLEAALRSLSYDTLLKVKESIARDAAQREKERTNAASNGAISDANSVKEEQQRRLEPPSPFRGLSNGQPLDQSQHFGPRMGLGSPLATAAAAAAAAAAINSGIDFRSLNYNIKSEAALMGPHHLPPGIMFPLPTSLSHSVSSSSY
jgi:hypothetical protein